ncbi:hypothetical protein EHQ24_02985 [Leptospira noumeaensis]|uniref:Uncharacterized protein n=1 Tax=Leptospira noumeaensis TaxID=2484964 RepID=A0A4R9IGI4_9LEPT|nr:hypothetical protein [Leptospira noumeaensis]TGK87511.1 hypothetical protein EHQ24_02985 [Leptospira noumeaensis]
MNIDIEIISSCEKRLYHWQKVENEFYIKDLESRFPKIQKKIIAEKFDFYLSIFNEAEKHYQSNWTNASLLAQNIVSLRSILMNENRFLSEKMAEEIAGKVLFWRGLK